MESISESAGASSSLKKRRRKPQGDVLDAKTERLPPHSAEAEQGVIGCILLNPSEALKQCQQAFGGSSPFYDLRHDAIYNACVKFGDKLDIITLQQYLKDNGDLDQIGGIAYLNDCQNAVPSAANLTYYLDIVVEKYELRRLIQTCTDIVGKVYDYSGELPQLLDEVGHDISRICRAKTVTGSVLSWDQMMSMDTSQDANCILGYHNGRTTRYLCKGHSAWLIGPSGVGKSSLLFQMGTCFATGKDFHGITTAYGRPMRILIVQAENDDGDMAEMAKGIHEGLAMAMEDDLLELARRNIKVVSVTGKIGLQFCAWLRQEIEAFHADIVLVDPLLSFAGIDVSRQDQVSQFCRVWLGPVLQETGVVMIAAHHTGKPPRQDGKGKPQAQSLTDLAYAGIGSSELVNWARAVMLLQTAGDNLYRLVLAKRGKRAGATNPDGSSTTSIWMRHADRRIFWEHCDPPAESDSKGKNREGRPSKVDELIGIGLGSVIDQLSTEVGKLELSRRIEKYAATKSKDVSLDTCKRAVEKLVENGAIKKTDNGYIKP
jgi:hypothetical protein